MKKQKWLIGLFIGLLIISALLALLVLTVDQRRKPTYLGYYLRSTSAQELPTKFIKPAFQRITRRELPAKADNLRAIILGGRDTQLFLRFDTDTEGIAYIQGTFGGNYKRLSSERLKMIKTSSPPIFFYLAHLLEEESGVCIFDSNSIESGLEYNYGRSPIVFIDDQHGTVYMYVIRK